MKKQTPKYMPLTLKAHNQYRRDFLPCFPTSFSSSSASSVNHHPEQQQQPPALLLSSVPSNRNNLSWIS